MSSRKHLTAVRRKKGREKSGSKEGTFIVERRKHPRIGIELPLDYSPVDSEETHGGLIADISEGGLLVYLPEVLKQETLLRIEILFVKGMELNPIKAIAKVVWSDLAAKAISEENRYGLEFQSFIEGDLQRLKTILKELGEPYKR